MTVVELKAYLHQLEPDQRVFIFDDLRENYVELDRRNLNGMLWHEADDRVWEIDDLSRKGTKDNLVRVLVIGD